ncbi:hypothetical protein F2Q70_00021950 [Brassica cretica]|uniref:Uncharacterized protein n=1 Tax=Brassica cretica TaxID=69181 RepID=A0A8S9GJR8_BRACR|nr:hypothetical protein F2Q70_00021950 [Brassica cretica]
MDSLSSLVRKMLSMELVPDGFKTVEYDGFVSSYQRQLYPCSSMCSNRCSWSYSIQFHLWLFFFNISCNPKDFGSNVSEVLNQSIVLKPFSSV